MIENECTAVDGVNKKQNKTLAFVAKHKWELTVLFAASLCAVICWIMSRFVNGNTQDISELGHHIFPETTFTVTIGNSQFPISQNVVSSWLATGLILLLAVIFRIFVAPKMTLVPGKLQLLAEKLVEWICSVAKDARRCARIGGTVFALSAFICVSTLLELFNLRPPLTDINAALAVAAVATVAINYYAFKEKGCERLKHYLNPVNLLIDLCIPVTTALHLFGSMLSGALIMAFLRIVIAPVVPAFLGVLFIVVHAVLQAYIFAMLTSTYMGEAAEYHEHETH